MVAWGLLSDRVAILDRFLNGSSVLQEIFSTFPPNHRARPVRSSQSQANS